MHTDARVLLAAVAVLTCSLVGRAEAAFLIEIDTDGQDDGVLTYNSHFGFGGETTAASQSVPSLALGMTGGDSIFGGDSAVEPDTYVYTYTPGPDVDNLNLAAGDDLGNGNLATGVSGGLNGAYNVFATWPLTSNVSGGLVAYTLAGGGGTLFSALIDQNNAGDNWVLLGVANLVAGTTYTLTQVAGLNTFVSMRSAGIMFEAQPFRAVPEPGTIALLGLGLAGLRVSRRRKAS